MCKEWNAVTLTLSHWQTLLQDHYPDFKDEVGLLWTSCTPLATGHAEESESDDNTTATATRTPQRISFMKTLHVYRTCASCRKSLFPRTTTKGKKKRTSVEHSELEADHSADDNKPQVFPSKAFVCKECVGNFGAQCLISRTSARREYKLTDDDLKVLPYLEKKQFLRKNLMNLFVKAMVEEMAVQKHGSLDILKAKRDRDKLIAAKRKATIDSKKRKAAEEHESQRCKRRKLLETHLAEKGLTLRADSHMCERYIEHGDVSVTEVVTIMQEMRFFWNKTPYEKSIKKAKNSFRGRWTSRHNITQQAKNWALLSCLRQAVKSKGGGIEALLQDAPPSLAPLIEQVSKDQTLLTRDTPLEVFPVAYDDDDDDDDDYFDRSYYHHRY